MEFRVRNAAKKWFRDIHSESTAPAGTHLAIDFDIFYFCFIAGIAEKRKSNALTKETSELVDYFPGPYKNRGRLLVGLFLCRELEYLGVTLDKKENVHPKISRLVQPNAPNYLSDEGVREFNRYAHGGLDVLQNWFDDRPRTLETFLCTFREKAEQSIVTTIHQI